MSNLTDALIAAKLVGGSGGSGGGSGLPEITTEATTIFAEQSVAFTDHDGMYGSDALNIEFSGGTSYTVTWDGTDYTCVAVDLGADGIYIGNLSIPSLGADTGEPFLIGYYGGDGAYAYTLLTAATHTFKIVGQIQSPAEGSALIVAGGEWKVQNGYGFEKNGVTTPFKASLIPGAPFRVTGKIGDETTIANNTAEEIQVVPDDALPHNEGIYAVLYINVFHNGVGYDLGSLVTAGASPSGLFVDAYNATGESKTITAADTIELWAIFLSH